MDVMLRVRWETLRLRFQPRALAEMLVAGVHASLRRAALTGAPPPNKEERDRLCACALEIVLRAVAAKVAK